MNLIVCVLPLAASGEGVQILKRICTPRRGLIPLLDLRQLIFASRYQARGQSSGKCPPPNGLHESFGHKAKER